MPLARRLAPTLALTVVCALAACRSSKTGVHVHVAFEGVATQQLEFSVRDQDGALLFAPARRPDPPHGDLPSPQDVVIYLPAVAGTVTCRAVALATQPAADERAATVTPGQITDVSLTLSATTGGDGGVDAPPAATDAGDGGGSRDAADARDAAPRDAADAPLDLPAVQRENGQTCTSATQCASTFCVDGVCCNSACGTACSACNIEGSAGTCSMVAAGKPAVRGECAVQPASTCGTDGTCDGKGACGRHPLGVVCRAAACAAGGTAVMAPSRCDGKGACVAATGTTVCEPYLCDSAAGRCFSSCTGDGQCAAPRTCISGKCGKKPNGDSCADGTECNSGHCDDNVCCNADCSGSCVACALKGAEGTCTALPAGAIDPHQVCRDEGPTTCRNNGLCNGTGGCQKYAAGTICAAASCTGTTLSSSRACDGAGACAPASSTDCGKYACNPATNQCYGACGSVAECAPGATCRGMSCR